MTTATASRPAKAATPKATPAHTTETPSRATTDGNGKALRLDLPTLASAYKRAASAGEGSRVKAYDAAVRAMGVVPDTKSEKGVTVALKPEEKAREVASAFGIGTDGGVFKMRSPRIAQLFRTYTAQGKAGVDPFTKDGHALFSKFDMVRKWDGDALDTVATAVKAKPEDTAKILDDAIAAGKAKAKARREAKAAKTKGLALFAEDMTKFLPNLREIAAKASDDDKAKARKALEALLSHLA
jgi:hypothetical protein